LSELIEEQRRAEEERASRDVLRTIRRAFQEALLALPAEEYDWFDIPARNESGPLRPPAVAEGVAEGAIVPEEQRAAGGFELEAGREEQKRFFEYPGPLFSVRIAPASCVVPVTGSRTLRAVTRDRARRLVEENLSFRWEISQGQGSIESGEGEIVTFRPRGAGADSPPGHSDTG
jgi:hypothetical protein